MSVALSCACCGEYCRGKQWWNRDDGYGVCAQCFREEVARSGQIEAERLYGVPGVHHSIEVQR